MSDWINVKDQLPTVLTDIIFWYHDQAHVGYLHDGVGMNGLSWQSYIHDYNSCNDVIYWMPIIKPTKDEE